MVPIRLEDPGWLEWSGNGAIGVTAGTPGVLLPPMGPFALCFLSPFSCPPDYFQPYYGAAESRSSQAGPWGSNTVISAAAMNTSVVLGEWLSVVMIEPYESSLRHNAVHTGNTPVCASVVWSRDVQQRAAFKGKSNYGLCVTITHTHTREDSGQKRELVAPILKQVIPKSVQMAWSMGRPITWLSSDIHTPFPMFITARCLMLSRNHFMISHPRNIMKNKIWFSWKEKKSKSENSSCPDPRELIVSHSYRKQ